MRNAETVLGVLRERGKRRWPLERIYRLLYNPELYLLAYITVAVFRSVTALQLSVARG
jgi:hypothetical protein